MCMFQIISILISYSGPISPASVERSVLLRPPGFSSIHLLICITAFFFPLFEPTCVPAFLLSLVTKYPSLPPFVSSEVLFRVPTLCWLSDLPTCLAEIQEVCQFTTNNTALKLFSCPLLKSGEAETIHPQPVFFLTLLSPRFSSKDSLLNMHMWSCCYFWCCFCC